MQRKYIAMLAAGVLATVVVLVGYAVSGRDDGNDQPRGNGKALPDVLPISQVVLFNSGVGYFQREGTIQDDAQVTLAFPTSDINDLLKSLVLEDKGGGKISTISYDSHDPIDKILRSFALDLNSNPSYGEILNQARGEKIEVTLYPTKDVPAQTVSGVIVGMEARRGNGKVASADPSFLAVSHDSDYLNLLGPDGMKSVPLDRIQKVRFLNPTLESELQRALQVLAQAHDTQKKTVSLAFKGAGKRQVKVGYVVERPIWKMTYRLRLEANGKLFLQGWALVENTTDNDWNSVRMTLVSGRPISFKMNLYEPLYIPRPTVEPELFASLRPPVYSGGDKLEQAKQQMEKLADEQAPRQDRYQKRQQEPGDQKERNNDQRLTYEQLQARRIQQLQKLGDAKAIGKDAASLNFKEGVASVATAEDIGDYFQYRVDQKISLARQKSAMLPIFNETIDGSKVSIYNAAVHAKYPLLGLKLKNTSGQPLTQGPITVFDDSTYAGDTRILDVQPNEERLLSYALDLGTEVMSSVEVAPSPDMTFKIGSDNFTAKYNVQQKRTYTLKNRSPQDRSVILEHPVRTDWKLVDAPPKLERTREVYRFTVAVPKGETVKHTVIEEQSRLDPIALHVPATDAAALYAVAAGVEVKPVVGFSSDELAELKIRKGLLYPKHRQRESKSYHIQNNSSEDRRFAIDYVIRPQWTRLDPKGNQKGPAIHHIALAVAKGKTGSAEIIEEHIRTDKPAALKSTGETQLLEYLSHAAPSKAVKEAITQAMDLAKKLGETAAKLHEASSQLKVLSEDQARLRENLKIIPQNSEPYKQFLEKFVQREAEIDTAQRQVRELQAAVQSQQQRYELFLNNLNAD